MNHGLFYLSARDRVALAVLLILAAGLLVTLKLVGRDDDEEETDTLSSEVQKGEVHHTDAARIADDSLAMPLAIPPTTSRKNAPPTPFFFDPNEADSLTFRQLGLSARVTHNILRYREKGGLFSYPEAFGRIYGMTVGDYERLLPYIQIGKAYQLMRDQPDYLRRTSQKHREQRTAPSDSAQQNAADSVALRRRTATKEIPTLFINRWDLDQLRHHPYINYHQARIIIDLRERGVFISDLKQLEMYGEFTERDLARIATIVVY